jgi:hypothetical protein
MKKHREEERRRMAEQQQHQALEILEEEAVTMKILKRAAISDFNLLSVKDTMQREFRLELYQIIGHISDSRVELALVSDRLEQKEALSRIKARNDNITLRLGQIEEQTGIAEVLAVNQESSSSKGNAGLFQKDSEVV